MSPLLSVKNCTAGFPFHDFCLALQFLPEDPETTPNLGCGNWMSFQESIAAAHILDSRPSRMSVFDNARQ